MSTVRKYGVLEGDAVILGEHEAWTYVDSVGRWREMSYADAFTKAGLVERDAFGRMFGNIESELPAEAFVGHSEGTAE